MCSLDKHSTDITQLLVDVNNGNCDAEKRLFAILYRELRKMARQAMKKESPAISLQPTELVHEVWIKLLGNEFRSWQNRRHFFGTAANAMRHILVDAARKRTRAKRGGGIRPLSLDQNATLYQIS